MAKNGREASIGRGERYTLPGNVPSPFLQQMQYEAFRKRAWITVGWTTLFVLRSDSIPNLAFWVANGYGFSMEHSKTKKRSLCDMKRYGLGYFILIFNLHVSNNGNHFDLGTIGTYTAH